MIKGLQLQYQWYESLTWGWILLPFAWVFKMLVRFRWYLYQRGIFKIHQVTKPVVIVGNLTVGGAGKTPIVIHLLQFLQYHNIKPGVISRGYKGKYKTEVAVVDSSQTAAATYFGDEPTLIAQKTNVPVVVGKNRVAAAKYLIDNFDIDLIISDDGLQHYALARDIEIVIVDAERQYGNQHLLPLGPLREPIERGTKADLLINATAENKAEFKIKHANSLKFPDRAVDLTTFKATKVHAVAAISNPSKFYHALRQCGIEVIEHSFYDHYALTEQDLTFNDDLPVLLTEKDAIKCREFAKVNFWVVPLIVRLAPDTLNKFEELVKQKINVR